jgi:hypothetical protein
VCGGKYSGCKEVWAAGPRPGPTTRPSSPGRAGRSGGPVSETISISDPELRGQSSERGVAGESIEEIQGSVLELRREMRTVLTMLSQQQAILALLVEDRPDPRPRPLRDTGQRSNRSSSVARAFDALLPGGQPIPSEGAGNPNPPSPAARPTATPPAPPVPGRDERPR